jgi:hypothetical protein
VGVLQGSWLLKVIFNFYFKPSRSREIAHLELMLTFLFNNYMVWLATPTWRLSSRAEGFAHDLRSCTDALWGRGRRG